MTLRRKNIANHNERLAQLGEKIRQVRLSKAISQVELSKRAGVSQSTITQLERGQKDPTFETLERLSSALNIKSAELIADADTIVLNYKRLHENAGTADDLTKEEYVSIHKLLKLSKTIKFNE